MCGSPIGQKAAGTVFVCNLKLFIYVIVFPYIQGNVAIVRRSFSILIMRSFPTIQTLAAKLPGEYQNARPKTQSPRGKSGGVHHLVFLNVTSVNYA